MADTRTDTGEGLPPLNEIELLTCLERYILGGRRHWPAVLEFVRQAQREAVEAALAQRDSALRAAPASQHQALSATSIDVRYEFEKWMSDRGESTTYIGDGLYSSGAVCDQAEAFAAGVELAARCRAEGGDGEPAAPTLRQEIEQPASAQGDPYAWESTTLFFTRFITDSRYQRLRPGFQKWYRPICAKCGPQAQPAQGAQMDDHQQDAAQFAALALKDAPCGR